MLGIGIGIDVCKYFLDFASHDQPSGWWFENTASGITGLLQQVIAWAEARVVLEATGGFEVAVLTALIEAGQVVCRINPRQARNFARATHSWPRPTHWIPKG